MPPRSGPRRAALAATLLLAALAAAPPADAQERFDLVLENGRVVDGTGAPAFAADVGVRDGRVARVGRLAGAPADRRIDVAGAVVSPGFVDPHAHAAALLFEHPTAEGFLLQGVTTLVEGNDGTSPLPVGAFLDSVARIGVSPNVALLVGHGTVRREVMGSARRAPSAAELERMRALVDEAMREGALGLSTGLGFVPGSHARTEEVIELARAAAARGGVYATHLRDEGSGMLNSLREALRVGKEAGVPVHVSHLRVGGARRFGESGRALELIGEARSRGVEVTYDLYPYTASVAGLSLIVPRWALVDGQRERNLADPELRARVMEGMLAYLDEWFGGDPARVEIASCPFDPALSGRTLADLLLTDGKPATAPAAAERVVELLRRGECTAVFHVHDEGDLERLLRSEHAVIGSDGSLSPPGPGSAHPRSHGTFPRVLARYVRERRVLGLEEAVRRMTSAPAAALGLRERGVIREGAAADLVVFHPERVADRSTFADPRLPPEGIGYVLVGGVVVVERGRHTGARPGRPLRPPAAR